MGRKFTNKLWNIARYVITKLGGDHDWQANKPQNEMTKRIDEIVSSVTGLVENYRFAEAANSLYHFIWHELADKYLEQTKGKDDQETKNTLTYLLITCLKLLHPFMPFVTEEIYTNVLPAWLGKKLLMVEDWPR